MRHCELDERGEPAYLEASGERSRDLYLRHGYQPRGAPYHLPGGPAMWPMWREPRPGRGTATGRDGGAAGRAGPAGSGRCGGSAEYPVSFFGRPGWVR